MAPVIGRPAPDFTLPSTAGGDVTLSGFNGKSNVLLAFFPLAFTSVCTREMCSFTEDHDRFAATGTTVLPISVDSVPTLKEFRAKERAHFLVDTAGVLRWSHVEENPGQRREDAELLEAMRRP